MGGGVAKPGSQEDTPGGSTRPSCVPTADKILHILAQVCHRVSPGERAPAYSLPTTLFINCMSAANYRKFYHQGQKPNVTHSSPTALLNPRADLQPLPRGLYQLCPVHLPGDLLRCVMHERSARYTRDSACSCHNLMTLVSPIPSGP